MTEWQRVTESLENVSDSICRLGGALLNWATTAVKTFIETLDVDSIFMSAAYTKAKKEHPEWVHKANYSKKKRTRKKYHDKIMQQYRRG